MPYASLMVALTPHMSRLSRIIEEHIDDHPNNNNDATTTVSSSRGVSPQTQQDHNNNSASPTRVSFSVEKKSPKFSSGKHTICLLNTEVVVRGDLPDGSGPFEQLMWGRRFKVGRASKDGDTIVEHRVCTVEVPEEIFQYAERQEIGATRARRQADARFEGTAYKVAPLSTNRGNIQPKKSDLFDDEQQQHQYGGVDDLPDDCTFHLMCSLEIVKEDGTVNPRTGESNVVLLRRGLYEVELDPTAMMIGDSTLLPVEMFGPFIEEKEGATNSSNNSNNNNGSVDIVAFASVFAVIGDDVAAATHGDDSNPSLISSVVALSMAAQYEHLVFNVFRPELLLYRQGMQMALQQQYNNNNNNESDYNNEEEDDDYNQQHPSRNNINNNRLSSRHSQQSSILPGIYNNNNGNKINSKQPISSPQPERPYYQQQRTQQQQQPPFVDQRRALEQQQRQQQGKANARVGNNNNNNTLEDTQRRRMEQLERDNNIAQQQQQKQKQQKQQYQDDDDDDDNNEFVDPPRSPSARGVALQKNQQQQQPNNSSSSAPVRPPSQNTNSMSLKTQPVVYEQQPPPQEAKRRADALSNILKRGGPGSRVSGSRASSSDGW
jgi:hypothetical protein